eukprot:5444666-Ditylum_brightwellii.AAC.1
MKLYVDADFSGNWCPRTADEDPSTAKSRTGYGILFASCPLLWVSKLQTCISFSTCESEYVALSQGLHDVLPCINLLEELKTRGFSTYSTVPDVYCTAFEDSTGALELAHVLKMRPRTKHVNL